MFIICLVPIVSFVSWRPGQVQADAIIFVDMNFHLVNISETRTTAQQYVVLINLSSELAIWVLDLVTLILKSSALKNIIFIFTLHLVNMFFINFAQKIATKSTVLPNLRCQFNKSIRDMLQFLSCSFVTIAPVGDAVL